MFRTELRSVRGTQLSGTELRIMSGTHGSRTVNPRLWAQSFKAGQWDHVDGFEHRGKESPEKEVRHGERLGGSRSLEGGGSLSMSRDVSHLESQGGIQVKAWSKSQYHREGRVPGTTAIPLVLTPASEWPWCFQQSELVQHTACIESRRSGAIPRSRQEATIGGRVMNSEMASVGRGSTRVSLAFLLLHYFRSSC